MVCVPGSITQSQIPGSHQQITGWRMVANYTYLQFLRGDETEFLDAICMTNVCVHVRIEEQQLYFMYEAWYGNANFGGKDIRPRRLLQKFRKRRLALFKRKNCRTVERKNGLIASFLGKLWCSIGTGRGGLATTSGKSRKFLTDLCH